LGCGEGRNAVYFALNGFEVVGLDNSEVGLQKMRTYAQEAGVTAKAVHANIIDYILSEEYDVIFSTGTLHFLPPETRVDHFETYKKHTTPNGINAFSLFVQKPFIPKAPDADENAYAYTSGELLGYYWDWEILHSEEEIFNCNSSSVPHKHAVDRIIARRYQGK
jgi:tellurite methyltransferase